MPLANICTPTCDAPTALPVAPYTARQTDAQVALSNSMGLGGHNSTVIVRRWDE